MFQGNDGDNAREVDVSDAARWLARAGCDIDLDAIPPDVRADVEAELEA